MLVVGKWMDELGWKHVGLFAVLAVAAYGIITLMAWPPFVLNSVLALLDVILVLVIFKGDLRI